MNFNKFFSELKRRNVYKVALTYAIVGWLIVQIGSVVFETVKAPEWVMQVLLFFIVIGFPLSLILAWAFEMSPQGMIRTTSAEATDNPYSSGKKKPFTSNVFIGVLALVIIGQFAYNKYAYNDKRTVDELEKSIAVLPFDDMSSTGDSEWFCDGVTEDILTNLSKIKELKVISRTSTEQYKNHGKTIPEIAKELGVSYILEGSVRKHANKVIITAQLIDANDKHIWAENYNDDFEEVFEIQKEVSKKIVEQLHIAISPEEEKAMESFPTDNMEAYQLYLQGRNFAERESTENLKIGADLLKQAITLDPNFGDAYAELGWAIWGINDSINAIAKQYYEKALKINPNSSRALSYYGSFLFTIERNEEEGLKYLEKALEANPNDAKAHDMIADYYSRVIEENEKLKKENNKKALFHINKAVELDPLSPQSNYYKARILVSNGLMDDAETFFKAKKSLFSSEQATNYKNLFYRLKAEKIGVDKKNRTKTVLFLKEEVSKDPNNKYLNRQLAIAYDCIMNDDVKAVKYSKIAYLLDSNDVNMARQYINSLSENMQFEDAIKFYNTENFKKITSERQKLFYLQYLYYHQKNYKKSLEILSDSVLNNSAYTQRALVYAQIGEKDKVYDILANKNINIFSKATVYAILKERDSMYVYLNKKELNFLSVNSRREFDPYRNEEQFKELLNKHYLPVSVEN